MSECGSVCFLLLLSLCREIAQTYETANPYLRYMHVFTDACRQVNAGIQVHCLLALQVSML